MAGRSNPGNDKTQAELLRRALPSSAEAAEACPDPQILAAYADRVLDAEETARCELHFSQCAHCREQLAAISRAAEPVELAPVRRLRWIWTWGWIALAPVTATLLIAAVLIARHPAEKRAAEAPLVAMNTQQQAPEPSAAPPEKYYAMQSPPEKAASSPSRARSDAGSARALVAPAAPPVERAENDREAAARLDEKKEESPGSDFAMGVRNKALDKAAKQVPAPNGATGSALESATSRYGDASVTTEDGRNDPQVESSPVPRHLSGTGAGTSASAGAPPPAPAPAKRQAPSYTVATSNNLTASQTVSVEAMVDRDERTVVRSPDPQVLWRISGGRYVEQSRDAGATWHAQWTSVNARVVAGSAPSVDTCWLVGSDGIVLVTTNGKTWHALEAPAKEDFVAVAAADASSATITASDGHKFETRDAGKHWTPAP